MLITGASMGIGKALAREVDLPDRPWEQFHFLGNTSVLGAYYALLDQKLRDRIKDIASRMTYIELSADKTTLGDLGGDLAALKKKMEGGK